LINTEFTALGLSSVLCRALTELDYTQQLLFNNKPYLNSSPVLTY